MIDNGALVASVFGLKRSSHWSTVEKRFRETNPTCAACGGTSHLQVHHIFDFHEAILLYRPDAELDPRNLITLCCDPALEHHLLLGHFDDFQSFNRNVRSWVQTYHGRTAADIRADAAWIAAKDNRPKPFHEWPDSLKHSEWEWLMNTLPIDQALVQEYGLSVPLIWTP